MILLPSTRQRLARLPFLFRAHDCVDETGLFALSYGQKVYGVFTRAGRALLEDQAGRLVRVPSGMPRLIGRGGAPHLLLEGAATNLFLRSDEFSHATWTKSGAGAGSAPVVTADVAAAPDGTMTADSIVFAAPGAGDQSILAQGGIPTVAASFYTGSLWVRAAAAGDVGKVLLFRHVGTAAYLSIILSATWQRVQVLEAAVGATSTASVELRPSLGSSSGTVTALLWRGQLEPGAAATSEIQTTTVAVTRSADSLYFPFFDRPRELSLFVVGVEQQNPAVVYVSAGGLAAITDETGLLDGRMALYKQNGAQGYRMLHDPGTTTATTQIGTSVVPGTSMEVLGQLGADGAPTLRLSANGGPEQVNGPATAQPLASAWGGSRLYLNSIGSINVGAFAFRATALAAGTLSRDELRDLCEVG